MPTTEEEPMADDQRRTDPPSPQAPAEADLAGVADPTDVNPAMVAGGLGGTTDGTQVVHHVPGAVPGKPQAAIPGAGGSLSGGGVDPFEAQGMDHGSGAGPDPFAPKEAGEDPAPGDH